MSHIINTLLRQARLKRTWTMKQAAVRIGVGLPTYIRWKMGTRTSHLTSLALLCDAFNMTPEELGFASLITVL